MNEFCFDGRRWTLTNTQYCQTILSKDLAVNNQGEVTIILGPYFRVPFDTDKISYSINKDDLYKYIKISLVTEHGEHDLNWKLIDYSPSRVTKKIKGKQIEKMSVQ